MVIFIVILGVDAALAYAMHLVGADLGAVGIGNSALILALVVSSAIGIADQWDRAVILGQERANGQKEVELKRET
jgi:hypothetical protein